MHNESIKKGGEKMKLNNQEKQAVANAVLNRHGLKMTVNTKDIIKDNKAFKLKRAVIFPAELGKCNATNGNALKVIELLNDESYSDLIDYAVFIASIVKKLIK